jgi:hypothetical protein
MPDQRQFPGFSIMWPESGPGSADKCDQAFGAMFGRVQRNELVKRSDTNAVNLDLSWWQKRYWYFGATDVIWTVPAGINSPVDVGFDQDNARAPLTARGSLVIEVWQWGNGKVQIAHDVGITILKAASLSSLRTDGLGTGVRLELAPSDESPAYMHVAAIGG